MLTERYLKDCEEKASADIRVMQVVLALIAEVRHQRLMIDKLRTRLVKAGLREPNGPDDDCGSEHATR